MDRPSYSLASTEAIHWSAMSSQKGRGPLHLAQYRGVNNISADCLAASVCPHVFSSSLFASLTRFKLTTSVCLAAAIICSLDVCLLLASQSKAISPWCECQVDDDELSWPILWAEHRFLSYCLLAKFNLFSLLPSEVSERFEKCQIT